jgi:hypothetical protein
MTIKSLEDGKMSFSIESVGGNGHICSVTGSIDGTTGTAEDEGTANPETCKIAFVVGRSFIQVKSSSGDCRYYCGARAGFDGTYWIPPAACQSEQRGKRHEVFTARYREKQYAQAYAMLKAQFDQCVRFFNWIEIDGNRNDLAVTAFHLGRSGECRQILNKTIAAKYRSKEELREFMPPTDFDNYLPVAEATWHNKKLCSGASK